MNLEQNAFLYDCQERIERFLDQLLPEESVIPSRLHQAIRYSALSPGKRIRPLLLYAAGHCFDAELEILDHAAIAVEAIHVYSLIHDDLPVMDDDDLRRGQPTCHIKFGEAMAILAGDSLHTIAYELLTKAPLDSTQRIQMLATLANSAGSFGMAGGQAIDLESIGQPLTIAELENLHIRKTGALIRASVMMGGIASNAKKASLEKLDHYAKAIGLAFQIVDDILDVTGNTETLGKTKGKDAAQFKNTYPALLGLREARNRANQLLDNALVGIESFNESADPLRLLAKAIVNRTK